MGWLLPKTYLRWREPKEVRRTCEWLERRSSSRLLRPALVLVVAGTLLCTWYLNKNPSPWWPAVLLGLGGGVVVVYVLPLLYVICPSEVRVTETCILKIVGDQPAAWKYTEIEACCIATDGTVAVLEIVTRKGKNNIVGIAPSVPLDELARVLGEHGVEVTRVMR
jgi:hypothetical protein